MSLPRGSGRLRRDVASSSFANLLTLASGLLTGLLVARTLGPSGRGEFAALMAVFGLVLVVGGAGQNASVTFHVARHRQHAAAWVAGARRLMLAGLAAVTVVALMLQALVPSPLTWLMLITVLAGAILNSLGAPFTFALQALSIPRWNLTRLTQPTAYLAIVGVLAVTSTMTPTLLGVGLLISFLFTLLMALWWGREFGLTRGRSTTEQTGQLRRFGLWDWLGAMPAGVVAHLDKLLVVGLGSAALGGQYAVALSVMAVATPVATSFASVAFPRMAGTESGDAFATAISRRFVTTTIAITFPLVVVLAVVGQAAVPLVFGSSFTPAAALLWWMVPMQAFRALSHVVASLLRGLDRPGVVAIGQGLSAAVGVTLMAVLIPARGAEGAVVAVTAAEIVLLVSCAVPLLRRLRSAAGDGSGPASQPPVTSNGRTA